MEHSYFFNSIPDDIRNYQAADFAQYFSVLTQNGVYKRNGNLKVSADGTGVSTTIADGSAFINGYRYENDSPLALEHSIADPTNDRIDLIVLRLDLNLGSRFIKAYIIQGIPSPNPTAPSLTQNEYIYEIPLAEVRIIAGQSVINQSQITDKRGEILDPITDGTRIAKLEKHAQETAYEEGVWTPKIITTNDSLAHTYERQQGNYVKIGNLVHIEFAIDLTNRNNASTGAVKIVGLPYAPKSFNYSQGITISQYRFITIATPYTTISGALSLEGAWLYRLGNNATSTVVGITHIADNARIYGSAVYRI